MHSLAVDIARNHNVTFSTSGLMMIYGPQSLMSLGIETICLAAGARFFLPKALAFDNVAVFSAELFDNMSSQVYCDRLATVEPITLLRLPPTLIHVQEEYAATVGRYAIKEQIPPWISADSEISLDIVAETEEISAETVIVARYGAWTWGHWIGELLPKIAMVEAVFPGRFLFAVPDTYDLPQWQTFRESIAAYGIDDKRLVKLKYNVNCKLARPWAVTSIWSDHLMHPAAAERMRNGVRCRSITSFGNRIAIKRPDSDGRMLANWSEVASFLKREDFDIVDLSKLKFNEQIDVFRSAGIVFSILGSALTGLIYAPVGVAAVSAAPPTFGDRFFYALVADRRGFWSDIRGPITTLDSNDIDRSAFSIEIDALKAGLAALRC